MRIEDFQQERWNQWSRISARVVWEDSDRPTRTLVFETRGDLSDDFECNPNAFLVACAAPAMRDGERRIAVDGTVCPALEDGLLTVLKILRAWYDTSRIVPSIEPKGGFAARRPGSAPRTGQFFSGGVDALTTLRKNRLQYPAGHPASIVDCLYVFGMHPFDYTGGQPDAERMAACERALERLAPLTDKVGARLHLVRTNVTTIFESYGFYFREYHSAILASAGHLFARRFSDLLIASSDDPSTMKPWGSHPLIDPGYSAADLRFHHDGFHLSRLEKIRVLSKWPDCIGFINACWDETIPEEHMNCGRCSKCLRTMIELLVCGALEQATAFPTSTIDPELLRAQTLRSDSEANYFIECREPLIDLGETDLVVAIDDRLSEFARWKAWSRERDWKGRLKRLDRRLFNGRVRNCIRGLSGRNPRSRPAFYFQAGTTAR